MEGYSVRKIWIVIVSMLTILTSSFANSAPMMALQMLNLGNVNTELHSHNDTGHCASLKTFEKSSTHHDHHHSDTLAHANTPSAGCADNSDTMDNCCSAVCANIVFIQSAIDESIQRKTQRTLISLDHRDALLSRQSSLFRPPIA